MGAKVLYAVDLKHFWTTASAKGSAGIFFTGKKNSLNVYLFVWCLEVQVLLKIVNNNLCMMKVEVHI